MTKKVKIMAAVDLSDYSAAIVRTSVWLSTRLDAQLVLVNVINQRDLDAVHQAMNGFESFSFPSYLADQVRDRENMLKEIFEAVSSGPVKCSYLVQSGMPHRELLAVIESEKPDMLVVGTKGRSNLADVVVGSTARKMYRRSPIPLITIPAGFSDLP